jgi:GntR family transcriptional regulator
MHVDLDRDCPVALYEQIRRILEGQIERGELRPGDAIPADREICDSYGVSRITVTRALGELARLGIIERLQGRRSVVASPRVRRSFDELIGLSEALRRQGLSTHARVLSRDRVGVESLPDLSGFRAGRFVRIRRLRFVGDRPAVIATSYLPERLANQLDAFDLENDSFYGIYERVLKRRITRREQTMSPIVANSDIAALLDVGRHSAHICVRGFTYVDDGELIELTESIFHGKIFEFGLTVRRVRDDDV